MVVARILSQSLVLGSPQKRHFGSRRIFPHTIATIPSASLTREHGISASTTR
jgi:hypothetical protein